MIKGITYSGIFRNVAGFCKLVAQNWHKNFALVRACSGFTWRVSDCEELVGGYSQEEMKGMKWLEEKEENCGTMDTYMDTKAVS